MDGANPGTPAHGAAQQQQQQQHHAAAAAAQAQQAQQHAAMLAQQFQQAQAQIQVLHERLEGLENRAPQGGAGLPHGGGGGGGGSTFIRALKLKDYDGHKDPTTWIYTTGQFMRAARVEPGDMVGHAVLLLAGSAQTWWRALEAAHMTGAPPPPSTWDDFTRALSTQFRPSNVKELARVRLETVRQSGDVRTYVSLFRTTCLDIPDIPEIEKLVRFVNGLKPHIRREIKLREVEARGFEETVAMAERLDALERSLNATTGGRSRGHNMRPFGRYGHAARLGPTPMDVDVAEAADYDESETGSESTSDGEEDMEECEAAHVSQSRQRSRRVPTSAPRMDPAVRDKLRQEGACFLCHKPGHVKRECPRRWQASTSTPARLEQGNGPRVPRRQ